MFKSYFIVIGILVAVTFLAGLYIRMNTEIPELSFTPHITGCAETEEGRIMKGNQQDVDPAIYINGAEIRYNRSVSHLCCRKVDLSWEVQGEIINIYEDWSGAGCKCECFSEIGLNIANVAQSYSVKVYERGTNPDGSAMEEKLLVRK